MVPRHSFNPWTPVDLSYDPYDSSYDHWSSTCTLEGSTDESNDPDFRLSGNLFTCAFGKSADDRQYGAFERVRHRVVCVLITGRHRVSETGRREVVEITRETAYALKELRHDRTRIAPGAVQHLAPVTERPRTRLSDRPNWPGSR